jgi:isopenicillin-N epimerase
MMAPKGSGFLHARPEVQHLVEPLVVSWGWNRDEQTSEVSQTSDVSERFILENEWQGTLDPAAYLSVSAAIEFQLDYDLPHVQADCHELLRQVRQRLDRYLSGVTHPAGALDLQAICPDSPEWYAQMAVFPLPPCPAESLQRRLYDEYLIEVPVIDWNGQQFVRVSIQAYNTIDDVETLMAALKTLLPAMDNTGRTTVSLVPA